MTSYQGIPANNIIYNIIVLEENIHSLIYDIILDCARSSRFNFVPDYYLTTFCKYHLVQSCVDANCSVKFLIVECTHAFSTSSTT